MADCIQMVDGDFNVLLDKLDELGLRDETIVIFAGDNGRDTSFHAPGNRGASGRGAADTSRPSKATIERLA